LGRAIREARKAAGLTQRQLAGCVVQETGEQGISSAYLNDIEHDRRTPSGAHIIRQFAKALKVDADYLLLLAGQIPHDVVDMVSAVDEKTYKDALRLFREALRKKHQP
jgi:transcriptional regulator with XRE-family HTH domain